MTDSGSTGPGREQTRRAVLLTGDLLFGSKVEAMIKAAGAVPVVTADPEEAIVEATGAALLVVDLTTDEFDGTAITAPVAVPRIGYYAHTDDEVRRRALDAGFAQVVPRSRMMREGRQLIAALID